jgi:hypothetical protein
MNRMMKLGTVAVVIGLAGALVVGCSAATSPKQITRAKTKTQVLPVASNPIQNTATQAGLTITDAMVENNIDPSTQKALSDKLQMTLKNSASTTMSDFEIYYKMTDAKTKKTEGYYHKLTGLTLAPGEAETIYFDNGTAAGHFPENVYSLYRTSKNEVTFDIEVSAIGFKPATATAKKSVGTTETQD